MPLNGLGNRGRLDAGLALQGIVEAAQEFPAGLGIVFPGIFAIQDDGHHSVMPIIQEVDAPLV